MSRHKHPTPNQVQPPPHYIRGNHKHNLNVLDGYLCQLAQIYKEGLMAQKAVLWAIIGNFETTSKLQAYELLAQAERVLNDELCKLHNFIKLRDGINFTQLQVLAGFSSKCAATYTQLSKDYYAGLGIISESSFYPAS